MSCARDVFLPLEAGARPRLACRILRSPRSALVVFGVLLALAATSTGCGKTAAFTWYGQLPASEWTPQPAGYVIGAGDALDIRVYDQETLSLRGRVRRDGRIALPLVGEVVAAGKEPVALSRELEQRLKEFIVTPRVTINLEESVPITVSVMGEVGTKGSITLTPPVTLLDVIARSGGLTEYADDESIYVLRKTPEFRRIRFTYQALTTNAGGAASFPLRSGDVVLVE
jgi:polysaccharide export outer membrane protein